MVPEVDRNLIRPGWTPLIMLIVLAVVLFFLSWDMVRRIRRIRQKGVAASAPAESTPDPAQATE